MSRTVWVALRPRDTVLVRDGRAFDAGVDAGAETVRPWPSTVAGAVGAAYRAEPEAVRGPVLARESGGVWTPHFPVPLDIVRTEGERPQAFRLRPAPSAVTTDLPGLRWLTAGAPAGKTRPLPGWLPAARLKAYLHGELFGRGMAVHDLRLAEPDPLAPERRVGLARAGRTARTGYLYQATHLRPRDGWAFLAQCVLPAGWDAEPGGPVPLGGQGRLADVEPAPGAGWPPPPPAYPGGRVLVYVATPALWPGGWRIPVPPGATLVAAAVGEPEPVATISPGKRWRETRALRWAVPAGSVYLLEFGDERRAAAWARDAHGTAYGRAADDRLRTAGFGVVLTGVWS